MSINYKVYELNGVSLPLDLDDLTVEARITKAIADMQDRAAHIEDDQTPGSRALKYVNILRECVNEIFDRPDAADLIFADENRLTGYNDRFNAMAFHIGAMRGEAFDAAARVLVAANAARVMEPNATPAAAEKPALAVLPKPGSHTPPRKPAEKKK